MGLKPAYKPAEVGMIPIHWEECRLGAVAEVGSGGTPSRENPRYWNGGIPWVTTSQIDFNEISDAEEFITEAGLRNSAAKVLSPGTLLMALYGQGKTRGKVAVLTIPAATNQACASISLHPGISAEFVRYSLTNQYIAIRNLANGGSQDNLSGQIVKAIPIALPPLEEQRAIAAALSDVDALLGALDRLIAKKRDIKQAAAQQLLTGQTRLPNFSGKWGTKRLGDLGETYGGLTGKTKDDFGKGNARYITFMNIMSNVVLDMGWLEPVRVAPSENQNRAQVGDLFFNGSSETPEEVGMCSVLLAPLEGVYLNSFCFGFRFREVAAASGLFLAYYFRSAEGRKLLYSLAQGATRYNLSKVALLRLSLSLPSVSEQIAIATVLSDMDAELTALEQRREKTCLLKQGMMQELLTGRIRLI